MTTLTILYHFLYKYRTTPTILNHTLWQAAWGTILHYTILNHTLWQAAWAYATANVSSHQLLSAVANESKARIDEFAVPQLESNCGFCLAGVELWSLASAEVELWSLPQLGSNYGHCLSWGRIVAVKSAIPLGSAIPLADPPPTAPIASHAAAAASAGPS